MIEKKRDGRSCQSTTGETGKTSKEVKKKGFTQQFLNLSSFPKINPWGEKTRIFKNAKL